MSVQPETQTITVNGEEREIPIGYELTELMRSLDLDPVHASGTAIAVNEEVIPRKQWEDVALEAGDTVEIVQAQQGG
jgi:sulfur carrier protein